MLIVKYKDFDFSGKEKIEYKEFKSFLEEGNYTFFYDDFSLDTLSFVILTKYVINIDFKN